MATSTDNSGMGVVLGILIAVLLAVGAYFFIQSRGGVGGTTTNIDLPDVNVEAPAAPAPVNNNAQ
jgi:hypothetical protein